MTRPLRKIKRLSLHRALEIGYLRNEAKQQKRLKRFGFILDKELTTDKHLVAFNPFKNKLIYINNGTKPTDPKDLYTDIFGIGLNRLHHTERYKSDESAYLKAKEKYKDVPITLVGHSLGGALATEMVKPQDRAIVYNAANTPFTKKKENVFSYRIAGDPFSAFDLQAKTIQNTAPATAKINPIQPHALSNIAQSPIFV